MSHPNKNTVPEAFGLSSGARSAHTGPRGSAAHGDIAHRSLAALCLLGVVAAPAQAVTFTNEDVIISSTDPDLALNHTGAGKTDYHLTVDETCSNCFSIEDQSTKRDPFVMESGAPHASVYVDSSGSIGMGTAQPGQELHLRFELPSIRFESPEQTWDIHANDSGFRVVDTNQAQVRLYIRDGDEVRVGVGTSSPADSLHVNGGAIVTGDLRTGSSRTIKTDISDVDGAAILAGVRNLKLAHWRYRNDTQRARHLGPMAEDFHAAFGLGADDKHLSPADSAGVALAAVQALIARVEALEAENARLRQDIGRLGDAIDLSPVVAERAP